MNFNLIIVYLVVLLSVDLKTVLLVDNHSNKSSSLIETNYDDSEFLKHQDYSNNNNNNYIDEYEDSQSASNNIDKSTFTKKLHTNFQIKCQTIVNLNSSEFMFDRLVFNESISDITKINSNLFEMNYYTYESTNYHLLKSQYNLNDLLQINSLIKYFISNELYINESKYADSGRYYCLYKNDNNRYMITSYMYLIYEEETIIKNLKETAVLPPCIDTQNDMSKIEWYYSKQDPKTDAFINFDSNTNSLIIKLEDFNLFEITYRCENIINGAYKMYKLECSNCETYLSAPLISPIRQTVLVGSDTQFTCEKPLGSSQEPDRYQWYKQVKEFKTNEANFDLSDSIGVGPLLDLKNVNETNSGWYICCLIKSLTPLEKRKELILASNENQYYNDDDEDDQSTLTSCSSVELNVNPIISANIQPTRKFNFIILAIAIASFISSIIMALLIYLCYIKLRTFKNAEKAAKVMQDNDFYQNRKILENSQLLSSSSSCSSLISITENEKNLNLKEILKSSSSIEELLDENEIKKWRIPVENLKFGHVIGRGAFGVVVYADLSRKKIKKSEDQTRLIRISINSPDSGLDTSLNSTSNSGYDQNNKDDEYVNMSVAIKKLPENAQQKNFYELFKELKLMFHVGQHQHIVNLIGYCIENNSLFIITDYAKHGNLKDFLRKHNPSELNNLNDNKIGYDKLLLYSYQIALGMEYLHSKKVLHRDLAARNILVDDYDAIKIADFGLARNIHSDYYYIQKMNGKLPLKWMSPESLSYNKISKESDVWSYGVLLWEIYTHGCTPYPSLPPEQILEKLISGYRMEKPNQCDDYIYENVILNCWNINPKQRPKFSKLVETFNELIEKPDYLNLKALIEKQKHNCSMNESAGETVGNTTTTTITINSVHDEDVASQNTKITHASSSDCSEFSSNNNNKPYLNASAFLTTSSSSFNPSTSSASSSSDKSNPSQTYSLISFDREYKKSGSINNDVVTINENLIDTQMGTNLSNTKSQQRLAYKTNRSLKKKSIIYREKLVKNDDKNQQNEIIYKTSVNNYTENLGNNNNVNNSNLNSSLKSAKQGFLNLFAYSNKNNSSNNSNKVLLSYV